MCERFPALLTATVLLPLAIASGIHADDSAARVLVVIEDDGEFEVLHSRAKSTATGAALFGLIGYGIEEGSRVSEDNEREAQALAQLPTDSCRFEFDDALLARLEEKGYSATIAASEKNTAGAFDRTIRIRIRACGFKLVNSSSDELSAFYAASYAVDKTGEKTSREMSDILISGTFRAQWPAIIADSVVATDEFESVRVLAGRRIANRLIYERE